MLVTDGAGTQAFKFDINVTNVNDQPERVWLVSPAVTENTKDGVLVSELKTYDQDFDDVMNYTLIDDGNGAFALVGNEIIVSNQTKLDYESQSTILIIVSATDDGNPPLTSMSTIPVSIEDVNEPPTEIKFRRDSFFETAEIGSLLTTLEVVDPDNMARDVGANGNGNVQAHICSITANAGPFAIVRNTVKLQKAGVDYERRKQYDIAITCVDNGTPKLSLTQTLTLHVLNRNEAPLFTLLSASTVPENAPSGTIVGIFTTTDPDNMGAGIDAQASFEYRLAAVDSFSHCSSVPDERCKLWIDGATLRTVSPLNYELQPEHKVIIETIDSGGGTLMVNFTISVKDTNDVPSSITLSANSVSEGEQRVIIGQLATTDEDAEQTHTYMIVDQYMTDGSLFAIEGNTLRLDAAVSYEQTPRLIVHVKSTDSGDPARYLTAKLEVIVEDVNEPPSAAKISNAQGRYQDGNLLVSESNLVVGACVGVITVADPDNTVAGTAAQTHRCNVVGKDSPLDGESGAQPSFAVTATPDGVQELCLAGGVVDFESSASLVLGVSIECSDSGTPALSETFVVTLEIENSNEPPDVIVVVGGSSTVAQNNASKADKTFTLAVKENADVGTTVATIIVEDPDNCAAARCYPWQSHTLSVTADDDGSGTASPSFAVQGAAIVLVKELDHSAEKENRFKVTVTDNGYPALSYTFAIVVEVGKVEAKVASVIQVSGNHSVTPGAVPGDVVGVMSLNMDANDFVFNAAKHAYVVKSVIALPGAQRIQPAPFVVAGVELRVQSTAAIHPGSSFAVELSVVEKDPRSDNDLVQPTTVVISTSSQNMQPTVVGLAEIYFLPENVQTGDVDGSSTFANFTVQDKNNHNGCGGDGDDGTDTPSIACTDMHECSVVVIRCCQQGDAGGNNRNCVMISGDITVCQNGASNSGDDFSLFKVEQLSVDAYALNVAAALDYEVVAGYELEITCVDDGSPPLGYAQSTTVTIRDVNEAPTQFVFKDASGNPQVPTISEGVAVGTLVGYFSSEDPDVFNKLPRQETVYTIHSNSDPADELALPFVVDGSKLIVSDKIDFETSSHYSINVTVSDGGNGNVGANGDGGASNGALTHTWTVEINVGEVNEKPTAIHLNCGCSSVPCMNGGTCMPVGKYGFMCLCRDEFAGRYCERAGPSLDADGDQQQLQQSPAISNVGEGCLHIQPTVPVGATLAQLNVLDFDFNEVHDVKVIGTASRFLGIKNDDKTVYLRETPPQGAEVSMIAVDNGGLQILQNFQFKVSECGTNGVCSENAICTLDARSQAVCTCAEGFVGNGNVCAEALCGDRLCSEVETCSSSPCVNGGQCTDVGRQQQHNGIAFVCSCAATFSGDRCESTPESLCTAAGCSGMGSTCLLHRYPNDEEKLEEGGLTSGSGTACASDDVVVSESSYGSYEDERRLCFFTPGQEGGTSAITSEACSSDPLPPAEAGWPCLSLIATEAWALENATAGRRLSTSTAFSVFEVYNYSESPLFAAAVFDNQAQRFMGADKVHRDITAVCHDRHGAGFERGKYHNHQTVAVCCGLLRASIAAPSARSTVAATTKTSLSSESVITASAEEAVASQQVQASLKTAAAAAAGVVVALFVVALLVFAIRTRSTNNNVDDSVTKSATVVGGKNVNRPKTSISQVKAPPRRSVAFVNPAYASAVDGRDTSLEEGFVNRLALSPDDDEAGYLAVKDDKDEDSGGAYLSIGDEEEGTPAFQISNPLFVPKSGSPEPPKLEDAKATGAGGGKAETIDDVDTDDETGSPPQQLSTVKTKKRGAVNTKYTSGNPRGSPTINTPQAAFIQVAKRPTLARTDTGLAGVRQPPEDDTCTFLASCTCTNCVDYE